MHNLKHGLAVYAKNWNVTTKTISTWFAEGAPLDRSVTAMIKWLQKRPKVTLKVRRIIKHLKDGIRSRIHHKRRTLRKGLRFKILHRDNFKCRYCGASSETINLVIDHVFPVYKP